MQAKVQNHRPEFYFVAFVIPTYKLFHHHAIRYHDLIKACNQCKIITKKTDHLTKNIENDHPEVKYVCDACAHMVKRKMIFRKT